MQRSAIVLVAILSIVLSRSTLAQVRPDGTTTDSLRTHVLRTRDGSTIVGRIVAESADTVRFESYGVVFTLPRSLIADLRSVESGQIKQGEYWAPDPNRTRLFFAPTARMLAKGEGYFSDSYLLLLTVAGGVTSRFTMGGGMSIIPSTNPQNNIFYLTPKVGLIEQPHFGLAAGALIGFAGFEGIDAKDRSFGILYGVSSVGSNDN